MVWYGLRPRPALPSGRELTRPRSRMLFRDDHHLYSTNPSQGRASASGAVVKTGGAEPLIPEHGAEHVARNAFVKRCS